MELNIKDDNGRAILLIEITGQEESEGWLKASCNFNNGGFSAHFEFSLMLNDFYPFTEQLIELHKTLQGEAVFENIESNINLLFRTDGFGHVSIDGKLRHPTNAYLEMLFVIDTDQTFLPTLINECNQLLAHYQVD